MCPEGQIESRGGRCVQLLIGVVPSWISPTSIFGGISRGLSALAGAEKGVAVYQSVNAAGEVQYVGITNNLARRAAEHMRGLGIAIERIPGLGNLSRQDARAVEQALIVRNGLAKSGGTLLNRINSIAESNPEYANLLRKGMEILQGAGYK